MLNQIVGIVAAILFVILIIALPVWFVVGVRKAGDADFGQLYQGLRVFNLPAPDRVEVNFRVYYGLIAGYRVKFVQAYLPPEDARKLLQRVLALNYKRGLYSPAFPVIWAVAYLHVQSELRSVEAQALKMRQASRGAVPARRSP